jgi:hypothetical protein
LFIISPPGVHRQGGLQLPGLLALVAADVARSARTVRYHDGGGLTGAERARRELTAPLKTRLKRL